MDATGHPSHPRHRTLLVRHTLPDGSSHLDWFIDRLPERESASGPDADARTLASFRVMVRPDDPILRAFDGERTPDHRAAYLTREGDIGDNRGEVARIALGWCVPARLEEHAIDLVIDLGAGPRRIVGRWLAVSGEHGLGEWRFAASPVPDR